MTVKKTLKRVTAKIRMPRRKKPRVIATSGLSKHASTDENFPVKRPIQRRDVYKGGDKRHRDSLRVVHRSQDRYSFSDVTLVAKSAPGSGRTSPTDLLLSENAPKVLTPSSMTHSPTEAKVVILGAQGVGKTSIILRYVGKVFSNRVNPTIGASFFTFIMDTDNSKIKIQLWDTAGQERFRSMAPMYYRKANSAIIVYDITNSKSFEQAKEWVAELHKNVGKDIALCVVGNKVDLPKELRQVSTEKGREFAKSLNALFAETSAALDIGIQDMFTQTAMRVVELAKLEHNSRPHSYTSYTSSQVLPPAIQMSLDHQQQQKQQEQSHPTSPNIKLPTTLEDSKKKSWCCFWR